MRKLFQWENLFLVLGAFLCAISVNVWAAPNKLTEGGIFGVSMLLYYLFDIAPSLSNVILNGILVIIGWRFLGKRTMIRTVIVVALTSVFLRIVAPYGFHFENTMIAALMTGLFMGAGVGLVYKGNGTTAGSTIIAALCEKYLRIPKSKTLLAVDLVVITPALFVIGLERTLLTLVSSYLCVKAIAYVIEGANPRKTVMVISQKYAEIAQELEQNVNRGITFLESEGYYSKQQMKIIFTVVETEEFLEVSRIVQSVDPSAFMIVNDTQNVFGSGFDQMMVKDKKRKVSMKTK